MMLRNEGGQKNVGPKYMLAEFLFGQKMCWPKNKIGQKNGHTCFWPKKELAKKMVGQQCFGQKMCWPKKCWPTKFQQE